jgi:hypothetical protein
MNKVVPFIFVVHNNNNFIWCISNYPLRIFSTISTMSKLFRLILNTSTPWCYLAFRSSITAALVALVMLEHVGILYKAHHIYHE